MIARERGSVSLFAVALAGIGMLCCIGLARVGGAAVLQARAETAADAAALAAADQLALGGGAADATAAATAAADDNGARLLACRCTGTAAEVEVRLDPPGAAGLSRAAVARARAEVDLSRSVPAGRP